MIINIVPIGPNINQYLGALNENDDRAYEENFHHALSLEHLGHAAFND